MTGSFEQYPSLRHIYGVQRQNAYFSKLAKIVLVEKSFLLGEIRFRWLEGVQLQPLGGQESAKGLKGGHLDPNIVHKEKKQVIKNIRLVYVAILSFMCLLLHRPSPSKMPLADKSPGHRLAWESIEFIREMAIFGDN